jgi:hypothetical protein
MRKALAEIQRDARIDSYRAEAARLLRLVQQTWMKSQIGLAIRDLQEAAVTTKHRDFNEVFLLQQLADCAIENAIRRLAVLDAALKTAHGSPFDSRLTASSRAEVDVTVA